MLALGPLLRSEPSGPLTIPSLICPALCPQSRHVYGVFFFFKIFFSLMWTIFKDFIEFVNNIFSVLDFSGGPVVENVPANARDMGSIPGQGRFRMLPGN